MKNQWLSTIKWLRVTFPCNKPIIVRTVKLKDIEGDCLYKEDTFYIRIAGNISFNARIATLLHEWAHALGWFKGKRSIDHNSEWGCIYAAIYQAWSEKKW